MPCCSCVQKLAKRLVENHRIDLIRAHELAEKAIIRAETRQKTEDAILTLQLLEALPQHPFLMFNPDYSQSCTGQTGCTTATCNFAGDICFIDTDCEAGASACGGSCSCKAAKPNSHWVSGSCSCIRYLPDCQDCEGAPPKGKCKSTINCSCSGTCYYDCDDGYKWNPTTQQCELIPVAKKPIMDGFVFVE